MHKLHKIKKRVISALRVRELQFLTTFIEQFPIIKHLDCWLECYECGEEEEEAEFFRCFVAKLFKENESICTAASEEQEGRSFASSVLRCMTKSSIW
jgi:hypothetical protein